MLLAGNKLSNNELNMLGDMIGEQDIEPLLQAANSDSEDAQSARQELVSMLMDRMAPAVCCSVTPVTV